MNVQFVERPDAPVETLTLPELPRLRDRRFVSPWFAVQPSRLAAYDRSSCADLRPHRLPETGYPANMVEGFQLLSLLDLLTNHVLYLEGDDAFGWNYGCDRVRFVSPVRAEQEIRLEGVIGRITAKGDGFKIRTDCELRVRDRDRPGVVAEWWVFWTPQTRSA